MAHAYDVQTIEAFGMPYTETRYYPETVDVEIPIISIEFKPETHPQDDYCYEQPKFVFGDVVVLRSQWETCQNQNDPFEEVDKFHICAMELVTRKSKSGRLTSAPYWMYGIRCDTGTKELIWFDEDELLQWRDLAFPWVEF
jgi:hypothetical protein